jgi:beta-fructofuranosidase
MYAVYFLGTVRGGRFDGRLGGRLDGGDVFYAPALLRDESGRDLMWGWAQERLGRDRQAGLSHAGALTLPRQITTKGGRLLIRQVPELERLRADRVTDPGKLAGETQLELVATVEGRAGAGGWVLRAGDVHAEVLVDLGAPQLRVAVADGGEPRVMAAPLTARDRYALRVFVDGSLIEVFAADGEAAVTTRAYPDAAGWHAAALRADGGAQLTDATAWRVRDDVVA